MQYDMVFHLIYAKNNLQKKHACTYPRKIHCTLYHNKKYVYMQYKMLAWVKSDYIISTGELIETPTCHGKILFSMGTTCTLQTSNTF